MCALGSFTVLRITIPITNPHLASLLARWPGPCIFSLVFFFGRLASPLGLSFFLAGSPLKPRFFFPAAEEKKRKELPPPQ
jgi:hypothetical protein